VRALWRLGINPHRQPHPQSSLPQAFTSTIFLSSTITPTTSLLFIFVKDQNSHRDARGTVFCLPSSAYPLGNHVLLNGSSWIRMFLTAVLSSIFTTPRPLWALRTSVFHHVLALELLAPTDAPTCTMDHNDKFTHTFSSRRLTRSWQSIGLYLT
jgi:hypothetical protein